MTQEELISTLAQKSDVSEEEAKKLIDAFIGQIKEQLSKGEKVTISGFGTFILSHRRAKTFINPKTGLKQELPDRVLPHFKAGTDFKSQIRK